MVDRHGLPPTLRVHTPHEVTPEPLIFDGSVIEAKPENLVGDRAYGGDPLDERLREHARR